LAGGALCQARAFAQRAYWPAEWLLGSLWPHFDPDGGPPKLLLALLPYLSPEEQAIVCWGRNGCGRPPRHLPLADYQNASGLETILGYLYLTNPDRLRSILALTDVLAEMI
jgi:hypothetical protein